MLEFGAQRSPSAWYAACALCERLRSFDLRERASARVVESPVLDGRGGGRRGIGVAVGSGRTRVVVMLTDERYPEPPTPCVASIGSERTGASRHVERVDRRAGLAQIAAHAGAQQVEPAVAVASDHDRLAVDAHPRAHRPRDPAAAHGLDRRG